MTITVYPLNAVSGAPTYNGEMLRQTASPHAGYAPAGRPLGARSAVRAGTPTTTVTATSTTATIGPHAGVLDVETSATAGPYFYANDSNATEAINPADLTNARIDLIYIQLSDPGESDGTTIPQAQFGYLAGDPLTGAVPATPARSMAIAQINVPASGGGVPTVTWVAPPMIAGGGILPCSSSATYPANPYVGQVVDDATLGCQVRWNGSLWVPNRQGGRVPFTIPATTGYTAGGTITFPVPFSTPPIVLATIHGNANVAVNPSAVSATTFTWRAFRVDLTPAGADTVSQFDWIAFPIP